MAETNTLELIDRQEWMEPVADQVQKGVSQAFEAAGDPGQKVKKFLHGTWLGHPLHSALTDVPIGAWSSAAVLDAMECVTGRRDYGRAADAAIGIGLAGAVAAALAGITDWQSTDGRARKVGLVHGLLNLGATLLYAGSMAMRKNGSRVGAQSLSSAGFATVLVSSFLGGKLVYEERVGVDHTAGQEYPERFTAVLGEDELKEGQPKRVMVRGTRILLVKQNGEIRAMAEVCSHQGGPLVEGELKDGTITCPWHGSTFCIEDGSVVNGPATHPQPCLETRVRDRHIEVRLARR